MQGILKLVIPGLPYVVSYRTKGRDIRISMVSIQYFFAQGHKPWYNYKLTAMNRTEPLRQVNHGH